MFGWLKRIYKKQSTEEIPTKPGSSVEKEPDHPTLIQINRNPFPYDDSSFLNTLKMEINSRIIFIGANSKLFSNSELYIKEYENLIRTLNACISITELNESEIKERIQYLNHIQKIEDGDLPRSEPVIENNILENSGDNDLTKKPEISDNNKPQEQNEKLHQIQNLVSVLKEKEQTISVNPVNDPVRGPTCSRSEQITPEIKKIDEDEGEEIIDTDDHSCNTLSARELTSLLSADEPDDSPGCMIEDHTNNTLGARELITLEDDNSANDENEQKVFEKFQDCISDMLGCQKQNIKKESNFICDLGADSLDLVEIVMAVEEEFGIEVPDHEVEQIKTVGDGLRYLIDVRKVKV